MAWITVAINLLKELEFENRQATPEEQETLSRYVGWGGLADAFDENKPAWAKEFAELYATLSPEEYEAAKGTTLNAHYTSPTVIQARQSAWEGWVPVHQSAAYESLYRRADGSVRPDNG